MRYNKISILLFVLLVVSTLIACSKQESSNKKPAEKVTTSPTPATNKEPEATLTPTPLVTILDQVNKLPKIEVTSDQLREDGKWRSIITYTKYGENMSPQLSWDTFDGASYYAIYMFDPTAQNWLHWMVKDLTKTNLKLGEKLKNSDYVGPYPPSGTHTYVISVYALKDKPDSYGGTTDAANRKVDRIISGLDISGGKPGNIIAKGEISGTYTYGEKVK